MKVKGTALRSRFDFARERYGASAVKWLLSALSPEDRSTVERALPSSWVPVDLIDRLDRQLLELADGQPSSSRDYGAFSARQNLSSVYKMFVEQAEGDPQRLLAGMAGLHGTFYDEGSMRVAESGPGRCRVEIDSAGAASRARCLTAAGFYEEALRGLGIAATVVEVACQVDGAPRCTFELSWTPS